MLLQKVFCSGRVISNRIVLKRIIARIVIIRREIKIGFGKLC
jgi:hypothetical protein